ncbi:hypothetical protein COY43_01775 [Candidatus Berkelbacteria bacterium CG_4_10_14_0_8_um_filter_35_9_33_8]|uniref:Uncharacterized protein n=1 Tax=Candidatus Berkelbacteria bacterium CG_4_10_14_0_2_um_filter_35_9_33_12 TaxID=1974499 RepID=A0A2M7W3F8_9BACT|nr:MAG: hypothetical protein COY43_01775 [Candidatus Berkelbacteria bacterium CG_4_10_14_0_8_um_filter_35_9_33_8]PJA20032.1 MAG: hypothetical protein COX60_02995 [Candidatus Berkelbacteria bacterium CG_4_10_14_0_2_um_filter_35_9_33_12]
MLATVFAKPNARENLIEEIAVNKFKVSVTVAPEKGLANRKIIELLSEYLDTPKSQIILKSGARSRIKLFEINL